ncbi:MAG TPA: hypothetical protein VIG99_17700 [Myxococcaceae bacterium]
MTTVHFGSFNAEAAWRDPAAASLPEVKDGQAQRIVETLDEVQFALCKEGDVLLTARPMLPSHREYLASLGFRFEHALDGLWPGAQPAPYAVVRGVEEICIRHGLAGDLPPVEVARKVNSKVYSHHLASALELFGAGDVVSSVEELSTSPLAGEPCILKDPFGVSGKGAIVVRARSELDRVLAHLQRQREAGRFIEFLLQPLHDRATDFSCHFEIDAEGWRPRGMQVMENDGLSFSAVRPAPRELQDQLDGLGQWRVMERVARALKDDGYRGPVCVDAMLLRDGTLVPLLEINARKSMGLINLWLQERFGGSGLLSHLSLMNLSFRRAAGFDEVLEALHRAGLLYGGGERPGVLPLSGNAVVANLPDPRARGRLYVSAMAADQADAVRMLGAVGACLESLGVNVPRRPGGLAA